MKLSTLSVVLTIANSIHINITTANCIERPIVLIIASYNNHEWYEKNLDSVRLQNYSNFRAVYIDDASDDGTSSLVQSYIQKYGLEKLIKFIHNDTRKLALANQYAHIHECRDDEIIIILDGDDWFAHNDVLTRINQAYSDPNVWLTYGQFQVYPSDQIGFCKPTSTNYIKSNTCRYYAEGFSHLRTFYAGLFKKINIEDLQYKGEFYSTNADTAAMWPMVEMAREHILFIPEVLYIYNNYTSISDYKVNGNSTVKHCKKIKKRLRYKPISHYTEQQKRDLYEYDAYVYDYSAPVQWSKLCLPISATIRFG